MSLISIIVIICPESSYFSPEFWKWPLLGRDTVLLLQAELDLDNTVMTVILCSL